jgi:DNA-binding transcriptional LysR family regulator
MDLNTAQIFDVVATELSFTKAAALLRMPKQTVSRRIAELEKELKCRLLERSTRSITLSPEGKVFYEYTKRIVALSLDAQAAIAQFTQEPEGTLSLLIATEAYASELQDSLLQYMHLYPKVELQISSMQQLKAPAVNNFDLLIVSNFTDKSTSYTQFPREKLASVEYSLLASPDFLERHEPINTPDLLKALPLIEHSPTTGSNWTFHHPEQGVMSISLAPVLRTTDISLTQEACLRGIGIAKLPNHRSAENLQAGTLVRLLTDWSCPKESVHIVYPRKGVQSPSVRRLVALLKSKH